jgi:hypothetical protein
MYPLLCFIACHPLCGNNFYTNSGELTRCSYIHIYNTSSGNHTHCRRLTNFITPTARGLVYVLLVLALLPKNRFDITILEARSKVGGRVRHHLVWSDHCCTSSLAISDTTLIDMREQSTWISSRYVRTSLWLILSPPRSPLLCLALQTTYSLPTHTSGLRRPTTSPPLNNRTLTPLSHSTCTEPSP